MSEIHHVPESAVLYARAPSNAELLLFDEFVITPRASSIDESFPVVPADTDRRFGIAKADRDLINFLTDQGIVRDVGPDKGVPLPWPNAMSRPMDPDTLEQMDDFATTLMKMGAPDTMSALPTNIAVLTARLWALILGQLSANDLGKIPRTFVPIYDRMCPVLEPTPTASPVVSAILRTLPIPARDVPLEAIIDFRRDEDAMDTLAELRIWANEIGRAGMSAAEIQEKLQELIHTHRQHMKMHKLETRQTALRTILRLPLEMAENIPRLRFTKIFDELCKIKVGRLDLLKAEQASSGRAVAYITRVAEEFGD